MWLIVIVDAGSYFHFRFSIQFSAWKEKVVVDIFYLPLYKMGTNDDLRLFNRAADLTLQLMSKKESERWKKIQVHHFQAAENNANEKKLSDKPEKSAPLICNIW